MIFENNNFVFFWEYHGLCVMFWKLFFIVILF